MYNPIWAVYVYITCRLNYTVLPRSYNLFDFEVPSCLTLMKPVCFMQDMPYSKTQYKKCAVIGNGGIIKNSKCGKEIDSADFVFRYAAYNPSTRTTVWIRLCHLTAASDNPKKNKQSVFMWELHYDKHIYFCSLIAMWLWLCKLKCFSNTWQNIPVVSHCNCNIYNGLKSNNPDHISFEFNCATLCVFA